MTVKELIEKLQEQNPDADVYTKYDDDIALIVTDVRANVLDGSSETVLLD